MTRTKRRSSELTCWLRVLETETEEEFTDEPPSLPGVSVVETTGTCTEERSRSLAKCRQVGNVVPLRRAV